VVGAVFILAQIELESVAAEFGEDAMLKEGLKPLRSIGGALTDGQLPGEFQKSRKRYRLFSESAFWHTISV
jgi:hypothetical protein